MNVSAHSDPTAPFAIGMVTDDGRPFPSVPLNAVSDIDVVTQSGSFLKKALIVEQGKKLQVWSTATESIISSFPTGACPGAPLYEDWGPNRVSIDPTGLLAYVLHKKELAACPEFIPPASGGRLGIPISILNVGSPALTPADLDANGTPDRISVFGPLPYGIPDQQPVDSAARLYDIPCGSMDFANGNWTNVGFFDGAGAYRSRFLAVTQSGPSVQLGIGCSGNPPSCHFPDLGTPHGCNPLFDPQCHRCSYFPPNCDTVRTPLWLVVYDLNPRRAKGCTGPGQTVQLSDTVANGYFLQPRAAFSLEGDLNTRDIEIGLSLGTSATNDDLYVVEPLADRVVKERLANILWAGANGAYVPNSFGFPQPGVQIAIPATAQIANMPVGSMPTDVTVMKSQSVDYAYITLGSSNQIVKRAAVGFDTAPSTPALIAPSVVGNVVFPVAVAHRDQGDAVFTANFFDGSISPLDGVSVGLRNGSGMNALPIGSEVERIAIQLQTCSNCSALSLAMIVGAAPVDSFDSPAHRMALAGEIGALATTTEKAQSSPSAIDALAQGIVRKADRWILDSTLKAAVDSGLSDVVSLYAVERNGH